MKTVELVEFESFNNCYWWDFEENKTIEWGIINRATFVIPDGFHVGEDAAGMKHFFENKSGWICETKTSYKNGEEGEVFIIDSTSFGGKRIKLERVKTND